jgi:hypothetical protein
MLQFSNELFRLKPDFLFVLTEESIFILQNKNTQYTELCYHYQYSDLCWEKIIVTEIKAKVNHKLLFLFSLKVLVIIQYRFPVKLL